ncbi:helix-turn-helix transcriptional regulator [Streptomyces zhihengii]|uniref:Helix-turn-helix transcriptional regulator n=3 Tax=Streptomyces zhihengii TaxID=1818004 RepID=A0ABS2V301_9ACTN|nr:helix-turn-helix domain-containing protein [Streptomyces zhihengii]MBM9624230.1 helix-turn-helix transcriptional regulator [Streptomyces zhihengii]
MSTEGLPEVSELAAELAALRDKAGISGNRLADRTGHDASNISRYWKGERHPDWDTFVLPLIAAVEECQERPLGERAVNRLRTLYDAAEFARQGDKGVRLRARYTEQARHLAEHKSKLTRIAVATGAVIMLAMAAMLPELGKGMRFASGDAPHSDHRCWKPPVPNSTIRACELHSWWWNLPPDAAKTAAFHLITRGDTLELDGTLRLDASCDAAVRWTVTAKPDRIATAPLSTGTLTPGDQQPIYEPLRRDLKEVVLTAHRTDSQSCPATLIWARPGPLGAYAPTVRPQAPPDQPSR